MMLDQRGHDAAENLRRYAAERTAEADFREVRRIDRRHRLISAVATIVVVTVFAVLTSVWLLGSGEPPVVIEPPVPTTSSVPGTTSVPETTVPTSDNTTVTTTPAPALVVPSLGEGWEVVLSTRPGDSPFMKNISVFPTDDGYYVAFLENNWHLMTLDGDEPTLVDTGVPGSVATDGGFVTTGTGVVAWAGVGPESNMEAQLWMSADGISFERVAEDLFAGCAGGSNCWGTEIYAAAGAPSGRVVALAYDPLVWKPECDCFELNPVALVSDDGREWTREPLDLISVLPAEWQGAADIRSPLVYVDGRWLTYGTRYYNDGYTTDTAFFASRNGIDWQLVDTGDLFDETYLLGMAANDRGVVALANGAAYWSADGNDWSSVTLPNGNLAADCIAAYDDGYVVVGRLNARETEPANAIWYSADGTTWSRMSLHLEEPTGWNAIVGDGSNLVAIGVTETNLRGIWRWSG